jgi:hypothetical protein
MTSHYLGCWHPRGLTIISSDFAYGQNLNVGSFIDRKIVTVEIAPGGRSSVLQIQRGAEPVFHANECGIELFCWKRLTND